MTPIQLVFALEQGYLFGLLAAVNSVVQNATQPERLVINIVVPPTEAEFFATAMDEHFPNRVFQVRIREYVPNAKIQAYVEAKYKPATLRKANAVYSLYCRLFLRDIFPELGKVVFLDTDLIVIQDIAELYDGLDFTPTLYLGACPHFFPAILHFGNPWVARTELRQFKQTFNAGVLFTDLRFWTERDYEQLDRYLAWDQAHKYRLFQLNDETILNLMFKDYVHLDRKWNRCGYGNLAPIAWLLRKPVAEMAVIHWSGGHHKPWSHRNIPYAELWHTYALLQPSPS